MVKHIELEENERNELEQLIKSGKQNARVIARARALLFLDRSQGKKTIHTVIEAAMLSQGTVSNVKKRYFTGGLQEALTDRPRPGRPPKITGDLEARLIVQVCSEPPKQHERWTLRLLVDHLIELELVESISHVAVSKR